MTLRHDSKKTEVVATARHGQASKLGGKTYEEENRAPCA